MADLSDDIVGRLYAVHISFNARKKEAFRLPLRGNRQRPILPGRVQPSTFGTGELNYCVRYGNRWDLSVITTGKGSRRRALRRTLTTAQVGFNTSDLTIDLIVSLNDFSFGFVLSSA